MNRYNSIQLKKDSEGKRYIRSVVYPLIPETLDDIYVETEYGDRVDLSLIHI